MMTVFVAAATAAAAAAAVVVAVAGDADVTPPLHPDVCLEFSSVGGRLVSDWPLMNDE